MPDVVWLSCLSVSIAYRFTRSGFLNAKDSESMKHSMRLEEFQERFEHGEDLTIVGRFPLRGVSISLKHLVTGGAPLRRGCYLSIELPVSPSESSCSGGNKTLFARIEYADYYNEWERFFFPGKMSRG
jgi:hypothetical protein